MEAGHVATSRGVTGNSHLPTTCQCRHSSSIHTCTTSPPASSPALHNQCQVQMRIKLAVVNSFFTFLAKSSFTTDLKQLRQFLKKKVYSCSKSLKIGSVTLLSPAFHNVWNFEIYGVAKSQFGGTSPSSLIEKERKKQSPR